MNKSNDQDVIQCIAHIMKSIESYEGSKKLVLFNKKSKYNMIAIFHDTMLKCSNNHQIMDTLISTLSIMMKSSNNNKFMVSGIIDSIMENDILQIIYDLLFIKQIKNSNNKIIDLFKCFISFTKNLVLSDYTFSYSYSAMIIKIIIEITCYIIKISAYNQCYELFEQCMKTFAVIVSKHVNLTEYLICCMDKSINGRLFEFIFDFISKTKDSREEIITWINCIFDSNSDLKQKKYVIMVFLKYDLFNKLSLLNKKKYLNESHQCMILCWISNILKLNDNINFIVHTNIIELINDGLLSRSKVAIKALDCMCTCFEGNLSEINLIFRHNSGQLIRSWIQLIKNYKQYVEPVLTNIEKELYLKSFRIVAIQGCMMNVRMKEFIIGKCKQHNLLLALDQAKLLSLIASKCNDNANDIGYCLDYLVQLCKNKL